MLAIQYIPTQTDEETQPTSFLRHAIRRDYNCPTALLGLFEIENCHFQSNHEACEEQWMLVQIPLLPNPLSARSVM